ncbi:hypothetical protein KIN20_033460 [Parelaphostrongylus tenuis]|uniref:Uncharacterized protein n=1 Tax=Parelaphostrongylus tenuis TaxID=148309 RepID=A0AAD5WIW1_PARTN|nr:hypothetical protein KIN20_033460 [Parelaphostrongylus tenuis]
MSVLIKNPLPTCNTRNLPLTSTIPYRKDCDLSADMSRNEVSDVRNFSPSGWPLLIYGYSRATTYDRTCCVAISCVYISTHTGQFRGGSILQI